MSSIFASPSSSAAAPAVPDATLRIQTSLEGVARPIIWGQTRVAGNVIWYNDFYAVSVSSGGSSSGGGGKGGLFSTPASTSSSYNYFTSVEIGICEGFVNAYGQIWADKALTSFSAAGLTAFGGNPSQLPWSYLTTQHPDQALSYRYTSYLAGNIALGSSSSLPNWTFEVTSSVSNGAPGVVDAEFTNFLTDFLTNPGYGVPGWLAGYNADWTQARNYGMSASMFISYALTSQTSAQSLLSDIITSMNIMPVWSDATLKLVPLGDMAIAGNGAAYFPPTTPIYDLGDSDFLPNQASFGTSTADPVSGQRMPPREQNNVIKVEYLDRSNSYDPATISAQDDGAVLKYGLRGSSGVNSWHWFQTGYAAQMAANLALGREKIANTYTFTLRPRYILLDPGDIVTITDAALGLFRQWVRITSVVENSDRSLNFQVQEYLAGSANAPAYGREVNQGTAPNYNVAPGGTNTPMFFEPSDQLAGGLQLWIAVSGQVPATYGGCDAYVSYDGATYSRVPGGRVFGSARMGVLAQPLPAYPIIPSVPQTVDLTNGLVVNLSQSAGQLLSGSVADALGLNTICYVDGEIIAYQQAVLTSPFNYNLSYLVRNNYGTAAQNVLHPIGSNFIRLDDSILKVPFDITRIGAVVYMKFVPFNVWGSGGSTLADVPAYTYKLQGSALSSPLPVPQNPRTVFESGFQKIWWDDISDFRTGIRYIIKKGPTYASATTLGDVAHPPFVAFGDGTYWVDAYCQPLASLLVFSSAPASITIAGSMLTDNVVSTIDFQATGWAGTFTQVSKEGTDPTALLRLTGSANFLADANVLTDPDVLNAGSAFLNGTWQSNLVIDAGYNANCSINASWLTAGVPIGTNILTVNDLLNDPDVLSSASNAFVNVWVEIRWATAGTFASPTWGAWQKFVPGIYFAEFIQFRIQFVTVDPTVIAYCTAFASQISIPARIDNYINNNVTTAGMTINFVPNNATAAKPFNGGTLSGGVNHTLPAVSMDWPGNVGVNYIVDSLTLSAITFHFVNSAGTTVAVSGVNVHIEGY